MVESLRDSAFERALPHSSEAERAILGAIVIDNGLMSHAVELLKEEDFYVPSNRRIFVAMLALFQKGAEINPILIGEELKKENALESVGGVTFISNLTYGLPHSTNIEHYAKVVKGKSGLRQLIRVANKITQEALEEEDDAEVIHANAETAIFGLRDENPKGRPVLIKPIAEEVLERVQEQEGRQAVLLGLTTGYADLDKLTSGWQQQDLILVAARPRVGKTSFALMLAEHAAIHVPGTVVVIFSMEMSKKAIVTRILCGQANIDQTRFRNGFLSKPEWAQIAKSLGTLADTKILIDDSAALSPLEMRAKLMRVVAEYGRVDLVIADYLQLARADEKKHDSEHSRLSSISKGYKSLAKEFNVPWIALSQLSRAPEKRGDPTPQLADLRGSGSLEEDADVVVMLHRKELYKNAEDRDSMPDDEKNVMETIIAKNRNGPEDVVRLRFTPSSMRIDNLYRE